GDLRRDYFWKILGRRSGDFPTREYKLPLGLKVPFDTGGMVRDSRFLNAEVDEDEAERLTREDVDGHQRELLKDLVDVIEDACTPPSGFRPTNTEPVRTRSCSTRHPERSCAGTSRRRAAASASS